MDITAPKVGNNFGLGIDDSCGTIDGARGGVERSVLLAVFPEEDSRLSLVSWCIDSRLSSSKLFEHSSRVDVEPRIPVEALAIDSRRFSCGLETYRMTKATRYLLTNVI